MTRGYLNNSVTLNSSMAATQFYNSSMLTILATKGANLVAATVNSNLVRLAHFVYGYRVFFLFVQPFGSYLNAVLCPPKGCYTPPPINVINKYYWSDPAAWPGKQLPRANEDVCNMKGSLNNIDDV